jgi:hypothetical protein
MIRAALGFGGVAVVAAVAGFVTGMPAAANAAKWLVVTSLIMAGLTLIRGPRYVTSRRERESVA